MEITPNPKEVGERIRSIRKNLGLSMTDFAAKIDEKAKSGTVSNWETGKNLPNNERLKRIADIGNTNVNFLLHGGTTDFIINNLKNLLPIEYKDFRGISSDWIFYLSKQIDEKGISVFEIEKIKSIVNEYLPKIIEDFEKYHDKMLSFIAKNIEHKKQCINYFMSANSSFDKTGIEKIEYIFENANLLSLEEMVLLHSNIEDLYIYLDSISNNKPFFLETNAFLLDASSLKTIGDLDFENATQLKTCEVPYIESTKPFPHKYKYHDILIRISEDDVTEYENKGCHILVNYFPNLTYDLLAKYFIHERIVIVYNKKIYIGTLDEQMNFITNNKKLAIQNINIKNNVFPIAALYNG